MHQLRAGINAGSKQELARGLPFGANRSQNPAAAEERPPQDRDAAAFRTPGGRWRVGVGWAAAPALRHTGSPRLGRARGRGMPFPGASSLQTCSNPPPPPVPPSLPRLQPLCRRFSSHKGATCHFSGRPSSKARGEKRESGSGSQLQQGPQAAARGQGGALPAGAPQTLAVRRAGKEEAARRPAPRPRPPRPCPPRPRSPRGSGRSPPAGAPRSPPRTPLFANSGHMGERGGERGLSPRGRGAAASSSRRRPAQLPALTSRLSRVLSML